MGNVCDAVLVQYMHVKYLRILTCDAKYSGRSIYFFFRRMIFDRYLGKSEFSIFDPKYYNFNPLFRSVILYCNIVVKR